MPKSKVCPFMSSPLREVECIEHRCMMWTQVMGTNQQTGEQLNQWSCAVAWLPTLILDVSNRVRGSTAATESFRNEVVKASRRPSDLPAVDAEWQPLDPPKLTP